MTMALRITTMKLVARTLLIGLLTMMPALPEKFYSDDPLQKEPPPRNVEDARYRKLSDYYDFFRNSFGKAGDRRDDEGAAEVTAQDINSLGEAMASAWWEPRHYYQQLSIDELKAGPGGNHPPAAGTWTIVAAKSEGITPGFTMRDANGDLFVLKFDPVQYPELATGADMITSRIFYAAGYHVPEYYVVRFSADDLRLDDDVNLRDEFGQVRKMRRKDVIELLLDAPRDSTGDYRGIASRMLPGKPLGPFRFDGTRSDDPNDTVPHEHLRALRAYRVLCAFVNHDDSRSINTLDMLHKDADGRQYVKHYPIDFGSTLGSATSGPNAPRNGYEYVWEPKPAAKNLFSLGIRVPKWAKKKYPKIESAGHFEAEVFDPVRWVPEYHNPAFINALPDDLFWGAKQVMALSDNDIRAIVTAAEYSDQRATDYVAQTLIERRDKIGRAFFAGVLPVDKFTLEGDNLVFEDLEVKHGFVDARSHQIQWSNFDNGTEAKTPISSATSTRIPEVSDGGYLAADITAEDPEKAVTVYLRKRGGKLSVVGIDRTYPDSSPRGR
jgi:hypothetical protein